MPCEKELSQKHDPPPEAENDTRDKDRIETQSRQGEHMELLLKM